MSIRRKSTAHDLATLRLHPDGSRVQQSSANTRYRKAKSTVVDSRGNWIAKDAGGKGSVKTRRHIVDIDADDVEREHIDLGEEATCSQSKGKQRARDSQGAPDEDAVQEPGLEQLNPRTRQRLSFLQDLSFLDPPPVAISSLEHDTDHPDVTFAREPTIIFPDPAPDLLKSIHHFASCHYRERGQLFDSSRDYRGKKKERRKSRNIHILIANTLEHHEVDDSELELTDTEDESVEENEDQTEVAGVDDDGGEEARAEVDTYGNDMYKAFDGSALMAIGIVLQEYVAHVLTSTSRTSEEAGSPKRKRTG